MWNVALVLLKSLLNFLLICREKIILLKEAMDFRLQCFHGSAKCHNNIQMHSRTKHFPAKHNINYDTTCLLPKVDPVYFGNVSFGGEHRADLDLAGGTYIISGLRAPLDP